MAGGADGWRSGWLAERVAAGPSSPANPVSPNLSIRISSLRASAIDECDTLTERAVRVPHSSVRQFSEGVTGEVSGTSVHGVATRIGIRIPGRSASLGRRETTGQRAWAAEKPPVSVPGPPRDHYSALGAGRAHGPGLFRRG